MRGIAPVRVDGPVFTSIEDAERYVFRLRWEAETGYALPADDVLAGESAGT